MPPKLRASGNKRSRDRRIPNRVLQEEDARRRCTCTEQVMDEQRIPQIPSRMAGTKWRRGCPRPRSGMDEQETSVRWCRMMLRRERPSSARGCNGFAVRGHSSWPRHTDGTNAMDQETSCSVDLRITGELSTNHQRGERNLDDDNLLRITSSRADRRPSLYEHHFADNLTDMRLPPFSLSRLSSLSHYRPSVQITAGWRPGW